MAMPSAQSSSNPKGGYKGGMMEAKEYEPTAYLAGHNKGWNDAYILGIKEVVEFITGLNLEFITVKELLDSSRWQAFLKEKGIKPS